MKKKVIKIISMMLAVVLTAGLASMVNVVNSYASPDEPVAADWISKNIVVNNDPGIAIPENKAVAPKETLTVSLNTMLESPEASLVLDVAEPKDITGSWQYLDEAGMAWVTYPGKTKTADESDNSITIEPTEQEAADHVKIRFLIEIAVGSDTVSYCSDELSVENKYPVSLNVLGDKGGLVGFEGGKAELNSSADYFSLQEFTIIAAPDLGYEFAGWRDKDNNAVWTKADRVKTLQKDASIEAYTAEFKEVGISRCTGIEDKAGFDSILTAFTEASAIPGDFTKGGEYELKIVVDPEYSVKTVKLVTGETESELAFTAGTDGTISAQLVIPDADEFKIVIETEKKAVTKVTGIKLDKKEAEVGKMRTLQLGATVTPEIATDKSITWTSSNENVAKVDENGLVTGVDLGECTITAATNDGKFTAECKVITRFNDVMTGDVSAGPFQSVYWAADNGIVVGYRDDGTFRPANDCTRQQFVVMLWRMAGRPEAEEPENFFSDVDSSMSSYRAIKWAVSEGIIVGYDDGTFRPYNNLTRRQIVVMIWRIMKKPVPGIASAFPDVSDTDSAYRAIQWAAENSLVRGYSDGNFGPSDNCIRSQLVTILYRAVKYGYLVMNK